MRSVRRMRWDCSYVLMGALVCVNTHAQSTSELQLPPINVCSALQAQEAIIDSQWSELMNQYQRRVDLVPALVKSAHADARFDKQTLANVIVARTGVAKIDVTPELINNPENFSNYIDAQNQLQKALSNFLVVSEEYPKIKKSRTFHETRLQFEVTENRIAVSRTAYYQSVQQYNEALLSTTEDTTAKTMGCVSNTPKANFILPMIDEAPTVIFEPPLSAPNPMHPQGRIIDSDTQ